MLNAIDGNSRSMENDGKAVVFNNDAAAVAALQALHPIDLLICSYLMIVGLQPRAMFTFTLFDLFTLNKDNTNVPICLAMQKALDTCDIEKKNYKAVDGKWIPSLEYLNTSLKLYDALLQLKTWPNEFREDVLYALSLWNKHLYLLRKGHLPCKKLYFRGVLLPLILHPAIEIVVQQSTEGFDNTFGAQKMAQLVEIMVKRI